MDNEILTIILVALTAFFTLITGVLAIAVTLGIFYFRKLASDRQVEIKKLIDLQGEVTNKIVEVEKTLQDLGVGKSDVTGIKSELGALKREYLRINSQLYPTPIPSAGTLYNYPGSVPSVDELQAQIEILLSQISKLQKDLGDSSRRN